MFSHIYSTTIAVSDQDAAIDFYVNTLGWEKAADNQVSDVMRFVAVVPPGAKTQLVLGHDSWYSDESPAPAREGITMATSDIDATFATLSERGVRFQGPVVDMPWGQKATWFFDPDGNQFMLVEE